MKLWQETEKQCCFAFSHFFTRAKKQMFPHSSLARTEPCVHAKALLLGQTDLQSLA